MRTSTVLSVLVALLFMSCNERGSFNRTEIVWDNWGVPHIYAQNEAEMYYAFGWAQMQSHANEIMRLYIESRGKGSEIRGEKSLQMDRLVYLYDLPGKAAAQYAGFEGDEKLFLDAFVKGLNDYAAAHPDEIDVIYRGFLPLTAIDVLAHSKRVINIEFLAVSDLITGYNELKDMEGAAIPGSNSYAIAPLKSESGNAMLVANPHLPWGDFYRFYEAHLNAPDFNVYGVTLIGMPILNIAFNENLGWTHTVNTIDASDRYELKLEGDGYILDGEVKPFEEKSVTINILQEDSSFAERELVMKYSEHGPVLGEQGDVAFSVRIAGMENDSYFYQYHKMGKAHNFNEFEDAVKMMQIPMFNLIYADKEGNIMYLFNGNVPDRSEGDWSFWRDKVDGTRSDLIWNSYLDYDELPKLLNPETGFVQNANDVPWTATYPLLFDSKEYSASMSPQLEEYPTSFRAQRAINLIKDDESVTFEELVDYKLNTGMEIADRFLDDLLAAVEQYPDSVTLLAADILKRWDGTTDADSKGAVLFAQWFDKLDNSMFAVPWSADSPVTTPDGLNDPEKAVALLRKAAIEIEEEYGFMDVEWGYVNRFSVGNIEYPANGGKSDYGVFRTMYFQPKKGSYRNYVYHGDTFVAVVEFGDKVRAEVLLSYGNSSQPGSRFVGDQLEMLYENRLRTALLTRKDVLDNMVEMKVFK